MTKVLAGVGNGLVASGLDRAHWSKATPIREIFKQAVAARSPPYFNPHRFRNTSVAFGEKLCKSPEEFNAWSQNPGHEGALTTFAATARLP
ncbi:MAG: hypothetical protein JSS59_02150 [Proteobacteria bacterium]|nr:hypothetical protein [Pseudomonadota bacterium]